MTETQKLTKNRSFINFLLLKYLGSCNDSFIQSGFLAFVTYALLSSPEHSQITVFTATGLFMLPVFLFSALAGELADKYDKTFLLKALKIFEICIALIITVSYFLHSETGMLLAMFLTGAEATFFTPIRLSIVPFLTEKNQLIAANSALESGSYLFKFAGTIGGIIAGATINGFFPLILLCLSTAGFICASKMEHQKPADPEMKIQKMFLLSMVKNLRYARHSKQVYLSLLGLAGAWCVVVTFMVQLSQIANSIYLDGAGREIISPLFLGIFCLGIGSGAAVASAVYKKESVNSYLPLSAVLAATMMVAFTLQIFLHKAVPCPADTGSVSSVIEAYLSTFSGIYSVICIFGITFFAAMFIVPVTSYLQNKSPDQLRSRIMAANNITAALFTVIASLIGVACTSWFGARLGLSLMMTITSMVCLLGSAVTVGLLPVPMIRSIAKKLVQLVYHVSVDGMGNFEAVHGRRTVLVANHTSFLDGLLLWIYLHDNLSYAVDTNIASKWYFRLLLSLATRYYTVDPTKPMAIRSMIREISNGNIPVIFPEGRISTTGTLMKVYSGTAVVADRAKAMILPVIIEGGQYSVFSHFGKSLHKRPHSRISIKIMPPVNFNIPPEFTGRKRNAKAGDMMYELLADMKVKASKMPERTLFSSFIYAMKIVGGSKKLLEDHNRHPISASQVFIKSMVLGRYFRKKIREREVGLLLPNSAASVVVFMALQAAGKLPCMLNFSTGERNIISCCRAVPVKTVYTSRQFAKAGFEKLISCMEENGIRIEYLEDMAGEIGMFGKIYGLLSRLFPETAYRYLSRTASNSDEPAVVLFTSGSEGTPKGVVLSHRNIETNIVQLQSVLPFGVKDSIFNAMPMFHSFGLTAGTLLPVLSGIKVFMYPSPLHYKTIPILIYDTNSTAVFGTDTFLRGYGEYAHPYDMYSVKFAVAGGEKLSPETANLWYEKFGIRILEGYGATETAPVIAVNTCMYSRRNTVGQPLPGIETRIEKIDGIDRGGRLWVRGGNVMLGYMRASAPGVLDKPENSWYDTGDIAEIDTEGFIRILGRAKRFAKIGGEMVSLSQVEEILRSNYTDTSLAVISVPDPKKGEQLVLFIAGLDVTRNEIREIIKKEGISELAVPKQIVKLDEIPLNGTGKVDYPKLAGSLENL